MVVAPGVSQPRVVNDATAELTAPPGKQALLATTRQKYVVDAASGGRESVRASAARPARSSGGLAALPK